MALSFSATAKAEICRNMSNRPCCALAECYGVLLFCNSFTPDHIRIITESREFAYQLPWLFDKAFHVDFDSFPSPEAPGKLIFQITEPEKIELIMDAFGFDTNEMLGLHVNLPVLESDCCRQAFLRGAFLAGGSVTDPAKGYHLEITTTHSAVSKETYLLLGEMLHFYPKTTQRSGNQILYFKQSDQISDCLTLLDAPVAAMGIMEARLEKELNNKVNRRCNCDDANTSKVVEAAQEQLSAIRTLQERGTLDKLPGKLKEAAVARLAHPESTLTELAGMMEPPITKPAMNHRLKKLMQLAREEAL